MDLTCIMNFICAQKNCDYDFLTGRVVFEFREY